MYLLDTDVLTLFFRYPGQQPLLQQRILSTPAENLFISIISVEETTQGALELVKRDHLKDGGVRGYRLLHNMMTDFKTLEICPFTSEASVIHKNMSAATKRIGRNDCKIAAIALSKGFTVITRNVEDYRAIPNVMFEDWTREEIVRR